LAGGRICAKIKNTATLTAGPSRMAAVCLLLLRKTVDHEQAQCWEFESCQFKVAARAGCRVVGFFLNFELLILNFE
jgi:hypothetical protein